MKLHNTWNTSFLVVASLSALVIVACDPGSETNDTTGGGSTSSGSGSGSGSSSSSGGGGLKLTPIDDMEDQNGSILLNSSSWYTYNDETMGAMQAPIVGDPFLMTKVPKANGTSQYAANTTGSGFTTWGAGFGFDLNNDGVTKKSYDASAYAGITFWGLVGAGGTGAIRFNVGDSQTTPEAGNCTMCSDDFGSNITLTGDWQQFTIRFAEMKTVNWSKQNLTAINKAALYYVHFQASQNTTFDIWIDDISFFTE